MTKLNDLKDLYTDMGRRLDTVLGTKEIMEFWTALKNARHDFNDKGGHQHDGFMEHMRDTYGIQLYFDDEGNIKRDYTIVDEQKYLVFKLKY